MLAIKIKDGIINEPIRQKTNVIELKKLVVNLKYKSGWKYKTSWSWPKNKVRPRTRCKDDMNNQPA